MISIISKKIRNINFLKLALLLLDFLGTNPLKRLGKVRNIKLVFTFTSLFITMFMVILEVGTGWENIDSLGLGEVVPITSMVFAQCINFIVKRTKYVQVLSDVEYYKKTLQGFKTPELYQGNLSKMLKYYFISGVFATVYTYGNVAFTRSLPFGYYTVCDIDENIWCFIQGLLGAVLFQIIIIPATFGYDFLFVSILTELQIEFVALKRALKSYKNINEFKFVMEHHSKLVQTCKNLENCYKGVLLYQYLASTTSICIGIFLMTIDGVPTFDRFAKYSSFVSVFLIQSAIYCTGGTVLQTESSQVATLAFHSNWNIKFSKLSDQKLLILMIQRSQKPCALSMGGVHIINQERFIEILKTSFSFYTLMQNLKK